MPPIISKREELLLFYRHLSKEPQGFQNFIHSYALDFCNRIEFKWGHIYNQDIHIFAGAGLNGRYALAIAKELSHFTRKQVYVYVYAIEGRYSNEVNSLVEELRQIEDLELQEFDLAKGVVLPKDIKANDLLIDGLVGYEQDNDFPKPYLEMFEALNGLEAIKLSIEVPSGITFSNLNLKKGQKAIFKTDHSWGIALPSLKMFLEDYEPFFGTCKTLNHSFDEDVPSFSKFHSLDDDELRKLFKSSEEGSDSKSLILGFAPAQYGYLLIAGRAALSAGISNVHIQTNQEACLPMQMQQAELNVSPFNEEVQDSKLIALSTGLGDRFTYDTLFNGFQNPIIVGANVSKDFVADKNLLSLLPKQSYLVLSEDDIPNEELNNQLERLAWVQDLAETYELNILLLANRACICLANGHTYLQNTRVNYPLVNASSEILTGLLLALKQQRPQLSARDFLGLGAYIYQEAIVLCRRKRKANIILSEDIIANISEVCATLND